MKKYDFRKIEGKWQKIWQNERVYEPDFKKAVRPFYNLMMFPYPSAEGLHVGNVYAFTGSDVYGRFKRMQGNDVFEPIGLDGFGIHSENYALKIGAHPMERAGISEKRFYKQLEMIGNGFAWNERLETYDSDYYKWTQWIFVQMFKNGLAYRKKQPVNWCPSCMTVLADEQVVAGKCERCSAVVIKKELEQWFFRITKYADRLLKNLGDINPVRSLARDKVASPQDLGEATSNGIDWSERVKIAQRNWIGKSEGAEIDFEIAGSIAPSYVLLHGYTGSPKGDFRPWLKKELERRGAKVYVPALPHTKNPRVAEQVEFVLKNVPIGKNTVLLGHSLGAIVALKVLEKLKQPVRRSVLVAGFVENDFLDHDRFDEETFDWKFDAKRIRANAGDLRILRDTTDEIVLPDQARKLQNVFGGVINEFAAREPHVCGKQEPEVLRHCIDSIRVFTTRPDTLFGATYMVLAPEHPIVASLLKIKNQKSKIKNIEEVRTYVEKAQNKSEGERVAENKEKTGVELKGIKAINPATKEKIPVWVADYVLGGYGTGAIMAVPAHDERDFEFAKKYKLPIKQVIAPYFFNNEGKDAIRKEKPTVKRKTANAFLWDEKLNRYLCLDWEKFGWHSGIIGGLEGNENYLEAAKREIQEETGYRDIKFLKYLGGETHNHFFAAHKDENRYAIGRGMLFKLVSDKKENIAPEHSKNHKPVWIEADKMKDWLNLLNFRYMWQILESGKECFTDNGIAMNSGKFDGLDSETAKWEITKFVGGEKKIQYRLRDWLISRQRYWGPPIPMVYCESCAKAGKGEQSEMPGWIAVPEKDLPVKLPFVKDFRPKGKGESPLGTVKSFYETKCPKCGGKARRETDVSDTFLDSAWYFLRYPSVYEKNISWNPATTKKWLPVDMYIGGAEHSVLHLLYSRFLTMMFYDFGLLHFDEPFKKFRAHGLLIKEGAKMSKSKGNVVNPDEYIQKFGADALRMYLMFLAPFEQGGDFRDSGILGITRFLERVRRRFADLNRMIPKRYSLVSSGMYTTSGNISQERYVEGIVKNKVARTIQGVTNDIENLHFNTAISKLMILLNYFEGNYNIRRDHVEIFLKLLAPFAPHIAEEIWRSNLGNKNSIHLERWPEYDPRLIEENTFTLIIQVDGKVRDTLAASAGITEQEARAMALDSEKIKRALGGKKVARIIYVPRRLINIVTES